MNYTRQVLILSALSLFLFQGCDVSSGGGGANTTQEPDPVVVDFPVAYIERPVPRDEDGALLPDDLMELTAFRPGARLLLKDRASVPAEAIVITDIAFMPEASEEVDAEMAEEASEDLRPQYDVRNLSVDADGNKLVFSMRAPDIEGLDEEDQPTWNIWEYDLETEILRRIILSDTTAEEGQDIMPAYLADGRIVFSSNRQRRSRAVLLDEGKPQFAALTEDGEEEAFVLHVMEEDGSDISQITFNQSHDLFPTLLSDGRLIFLRWDNYVDQKDRLSLYTANPNGSNVNLEYGFHSQNTGTNNSEGVFAKPRELIDGRIQVTLRPRVADQLGGGMIAIDTLNFTEQNIAVDGSGAAGPAQESIIQNLITTDGSPSLAGYYSSAYPINDGSERLLVSWSPCLLRGFKLRIYVNDSFQLINENGEFVDNNSNVLADGDTPITMNEDELGNYPCTEQALTLSNIQLSVPVYGLWIFDPITQTQSPVVLSEEEKIFTDALVLQPLAIPDYIADPLPGIDFDQDLDEENVGILHIRSVYDIDGSDISPNGIPATADPLQTSEEQRPARFLRILKAVSMADDDVVDFDNSAFGRAGRQMKDILGYVPIEPDGSAMFKVPADVAFTFSILDANGKRISTDGSGDIGPRHEYWMTLRAGEVRECTGCHTDEDTETPHGRIGAGPASANLGALMAAQFPNTQLRDPNGIPYAGINEQPEISETMAQYYARMLGPRSPSVNITDYSDWTEDGTRPKIASIDLNYADLGSQAPTECATNWNSLCRVVINYIEHIQPLWEEDRATYDDADMLVSDFTCTSCHNTTNADGMIIIPAGDDQLNLSAVQSDERNDYLVSYAHLLFGSRVLELDDNGNLRLELEQLIEDGVPQFQMIQLLTDGVPQYEAIDLLGNTVPAPLDTTDPDLTIVLDENDNPVQYLVQEMQPVMDDDGNPILDINGDPLMEPIAIMVETGNRNGAPLSPNGAVASDAFFNLFESDGAHAGYLNGAELKLIAEWLDIGGQYYNNPFVAPE
ncbi:PD40 domain-containing protein [Teredinibacter haidensis]|uniref:HzsA-related protein n=1 Tax=Teredinibacter haidensis TaxID=2731755 RepID=UPI000948AFC3|nr:PD40 domain-containing protein [Teredinibacter haidensis]